MSKTHLKALYAILNLTEQAMITVSELAVFRCENSIYVGINLNFFLFIC